MSNSKPDALTSNERLTPDKLRAHAMASDSVGWRSQAQQLLRWAADSLEAAEALAADHRRLQSDLAERDKVARDRLIEIEHLRGSHETLPPRITVLGDGRAMGGSDVCHTCEAHCTVINDLQTALRGLYWDNVDYLTLNKLGGMQNHWMRAARMALGMDVDDVRPSQKAGE